MEKYHLVWLDSHRGRTEPWLRERLSEGFQVHHVDGDHDNDEPLNLILIDGDDHVRLHAGSLKAGIANWRQWQGDRQRECADTTFPAKDIYDLKALDSRSWKLFAQSHHGGVKPRDVPWNDIATGLSNRARVYAKRMNLAWPPAVEA